ncbi:LytR/AlgR family response regulator transcription factor [Flavobacterium litorale]|uniref:Response regulator transcription factor n=1 Tax=Flavobacterium litorale TaxID=2856519 RepID=A0ABX8V9Q5_9FLAO|nr:response regulator transcription factor [Flavobacterium litorale]QYJ67555.1 response regulator transcription factor [Flavobacterium litorale]
MNCIIIDDEGMARAIIAQMIAKDPSLTLIEEFSSAIDAIKYLNGNSENIDLIFLDIHMPGFTGFDFIQTIKNPPAVILITSDKNFAIEAFEYDCIVDYLVKPLTEERFLKAVRKAHNKKQEAATATSTTAATTVQNEPPSDTANEFYVNIDRRLIKIDIPSINLVQAKGDYIQIKTETKNYTVHSTLKKIEDKLPTSLFLKVHRTYIINIKKIIDIEDNSVLIDKDVIPVSRANRPELMKRLNML